MRAAVLTGVGGPEVLELRDVPIPVPADDEVLVEVAACGMNNTDINTRVGWYARDDDPAGTWGGAPIEYPRIQGADPAGRVVEVGSSVDPSLVGRRVIVDAWIRDREQPDSRELAGYLGSEFDGGFAEFCAVPARNVHPHDSALSDVELASLPCSWSTAEHMLHRVRIRPGQSVAVTGASGGVGTALVSLAVLIGARAVAIAGSSKLAQVAALGGAATVPRESDDVVAAAVEANGGPFDVVADVVGGDDVPSWFRALRRGGRYVTAGAVAGPIVDLDLRTLYLHDLELYGATVYEPAVFARLVDRVRRDEIRPVVAATYPLDEIHAAQEAFGRREHVGAIVLTI